MEEINAIETSGINIAKFNTRIQLKFDTWENWQTVSESFIPLKGEMCICEIPATTTATGEVLSEKVYLMKVGDGSTAFGSLSWVSAPAADVYGWAKQDADKFVAWLDGSDENNKAPITFATDVDIQNINNRIANAMHFLGKVDAGIALFDGSTTNPISIGGIEKTLTTDDSGSVVLAPYAPEADPNNQDPNGYEFVWITDHWEMLGQEGSFAIKGSIKDSDISASAAVNPAKIASTLNKTDLPGDLNHLDSRIGDLETTVNTDHTTYLQNLQTAVDQTWRTNGIVVASEASGVTAASPLMINNTAITYLIFDCGSSTENI